MENTKIKKSYKARPWTKEHIKKHQWLFNYMYENFVNDDGSYMEKDTFIIKNKRSIASIIENNKAWGDGSKEGLLFMTSRFLYNKGFKKDSEKYSEWANVYREKTNNTTDGNELDEKEKENWREYEYFLEILKNIDAKTILTKADHYKYLLLNLLIKQPPIRTTFYTTAKFIIREQDNNKKDNYIYFNRQGKVKAYIIVNQDKASNYKLYNTNKSLSKIQIQNDNLALLLYDSYIKYPRTYLFEKEKQQPISSNTLLSWLRKITKVPLINIDIMRSSYITHFYKVNPTYRARNKLAKEMRHSTNTAQRNYNKVLNPDDKLNSVLYDDAKKEIHILQQKLYDCNNDNAKVKTITKKNRYDTLYNINTRKIKPKEETIKKYNIVFDENKNIYI
jgi:hypothetical protein